jgi:hypothetical protein
MIAVRPRCLLRGLLLPTAIAVLACGPAAVTPAPAPPPLDLARCSRRLPPPPLDDLAPAAPLHLPLSNLVAKVDLDASAITDRLAHEVPRRVASARDVDAGFAGKLSYDIDRTPFVISLAGSSLQVETTLTAHAQLCKPLGPLGCVAYGGCDPSAHAIATVPLALRHDYGVGPARVAITVTRPCSISSLALDATPRIQRGADQQAARIQARINAMLPSFEAGARALWRAMGVVVPLGLQTRLRIVPEQVVQGDPTMTDQRVSIPLGVRGRIVIESRESEPVPTSPLPAPTVESALTPGVQLDVPIEIDLESASASASRALPPRPIDDAPDRLAVVALRVRTSADAIVLVASISGHACGDVAFLAVPVFDPRSNRVLLTQVRPLVPASSPLRHRLDDVARALERAVSLPLPVNVDDVPKGLERAVGLLRSSSGPEVIVRTDPPRVSSVLPTPSAIAVVVQVRGAADVVVR